MLLSRFVSRNKVFFQGKRKSQLRYRIYTDQINNFSTLNHNYLGSGYRSFAIVNLLGFNSFAVFLFHHIAHAASSV